MQRKINPVLQIHPISIFMSLLFTCDVQSCQYVWACTYRVKSSENSAKCQDLFAAWDSLLHIFHNLGIKANCILAKYYFGIEYGIKFYE